MVYPHGHVKRGVREVSPTLSEALERSLNRCISVILHVLVLVNIGLWFLRLRFHFSALFE